MKSTFTLSKTELKNGKFQYTVTDINGAVISKRQSNRHYVACTSNGEFYFGRLDLIGKGTHGQLINDRLKCLTVSREKFNATNQRFYQYDEYIERVKKDLDIFNAIAYLNH